MSEKTSEKQIAHQVIDLLYQELMDKKLLTREIKEVFHRHMNAYTTGSKNKK